MLETKAIDKTVESSQPDRRSNPAAIAPPLAPHDQATAGNAISAAPLKPAWSPIVLAGVVRLVELALIVIVGAVAYAAYVVPIEGFAWRYCRCDRLDRRAGNARIPDCRHLSGAGVPGYEKQYFRLASEWSLVFLLVDRGELLCQDRRPLFPDLARHLLRWRLVLLLAFRRALFVLVKRWTHQAG